jgi:hypothetical protein
MRGAGAAIRGYTRRDWEVDKARVTLEALNPLPRKRRDYEVVVGVLQSRHRNRGPWASNTSSVTCGGFPVAIHSINI